jgi:small subunit ribosomal protein S19
MARSVKKGAYVHESLTKRVQSMNSRNEKRVVKTWSRASTVIPDFVGHTFAVHNGNKFIPVYVTENMVGADAPVPWSHREQGDRQEGVIGARTGGPWRARREVSHG